MANELLEAAIAKAGTMYRLAKDLGESTQLIGYWRHNGGPPSWRTAQLQKYLETPVNGSESAQQPN